MKIHVMLIIRNNGNYICYISNTYNELSVTLGRLLIFLNWVADVDIVY